MTTYENISRALREFKFGEVEDFARHILNIQAGVDVSGIAPSADDAEGDSESSVAISPSPHLKRGMVLIVSNSFDKKPLGERVAAHAADVNSMNSLWREKLGCSNVKLWEDLTAHEIIGNFKELSELRDEYDYVAIIISTHGQVVAKSWVEKWEPKENSEPPAPGNDAFEAYKRYAAEKKKGKYDSAEVIQVFFGNDWRPIREDRMFEYFYNDKAIGLKNVTKFFILDYCRGYKYDFGAMVERSTAKSGGFTTIEDSMLPENYLVPTISDVLTVYATHNSYVAWDHPPSNPGSWLISTIEEIFKKYVKEKHVVDMLTLVNKEMKMKIAKCFNGKIGKWSAGKAMSVFHSSLSENFYLHHQAEEEREN